MGRKAIVRPRPQNEINARIAAVLEASGVAPGEFARRVGVTDSTVSKWLSDSSEPRAGIISAIAGALGVESAAFRPNGANAADRRKGLKSSAPRGACRFDSGLWH